MDADDDYMIDAESIESENADQGGSDPDEDDLGIAMADNDQIGAGRRETEEFHHEVLSPDEIVRHMCEIIREVTTVIQVRRLMTVNTVQ